MECVRILAGGNAGLRPFAMALMLSVTVPAWAGTASAQARRLPASPAKAPSFVRACTIQPFEGPPLFAGPAKPAASDDNKDDDSSDDDDTDDDDDDDDDDTRGYILPGTGTCLSISGTVSAGMQYDSYRGPRSGPQPPPDSSSSNASASFTITTSHDLASGLRIGTVLAFSMYNPAEDDGIVSLDEATVSLGPWTFGLSDSRFSFWSGDDFNSTARVPSRTVGLIGLDLTLTDSWSASLSLEDPALGSTSNIPVAEGRRVPDGVARLVYEAGPWTVHGAVALRDVPGTPHRFGRAGILGATYEAKMFGRPGNISGQIAGAIDGAPYIGSDLDARAVRRVLLGSDPTRGFSTVVSTRREWTDEIATNAYASRYWIEVPFALLGKGKLRIDRATANVVWAPVEGFKAGLETSVAWAKVELPGRVIPIGLAGRQITTQVFLEREF
jgi:hypothetical protein